MQRTQKENPRANHAPIVATPTPAGAEAAEELARADLDEAARVVPQEFVDFRQQGAHLCAAPRDPKWDRGEVMKTTTHRRETAIAAALASLRDSCRAAIAVLVVEQPGHLRAEALLGALLHAAQLLRRVEYSDGRAAERREEARNAARPQRRWRLRCRHGGGGCRHDGGGCWHGGGGCRHGGGGCLGRGSVASKVAAAGPTPRSAIARPSTSRRPPPQRSFRTEAEARGG